MRTAFISILLLVSACTLPAEKKAKQEAEKRQDSVSVTQSNTASSTTVDDNTPSLPVIPVIKKPNGIYRVLIPMKNKVEQTIAFNPDLTYQLQERYPDQKDSILITNGTWMPSDGYIWLYKDQVVRGRYKWSGDTLQYFSPVLKKNFSMSTLPDARQNVAWRNKGKLGTLVYGAGNEPFWNIELTGKDSISFQLSEWNAPLKLKVNSSFQTVDSTCYSAQNDSAQVRLVIYPYFCSDGMSDFTWRNRIKVQYNQHTYNGCGIVYR